MSFTEILTNATQFVYSHYYLTGFCSSSCFAMCSLFWRWFIIFSSFATAASHLNHVARRFRWYASEVCAVCLRNCLFSFRSDSSIKHATPYWLCLVNYLVAIQFTALQLKWNDLFRDARVSMQKKTAKREFYTAIWNVLMSHRWSFSLKCYECHMPMMKHKFFYRSLCIPFSSTFFLSLQIFNTIIY